MTAVMAAVTMAVSPAIAKSAVKPQPGVPHTEPLEKAPFGDIPKGPVQIFVSIDRQILYLYSGGVLIADATVATGVPDHPTPLGVFSVIAKDRFHRSNIYSNAPMPFMQRITWSGIALHEGEGLGRRASHGCIRMPHEFALRLWYLTRLGARVIIAHQVLKPAAFADPHLFVHKDMPPTPAAAATPVVMTAQSIDSSTATDAAAGAVGPAGDPPGELNQLRGSDPDTGAPGAPLPLPLQKPPSLLETAAASHAPIAIFISRKTQRIYVRQHFAPLFDAPIAIANPDQPLGTHVFTAMGAADGSAFRWDVVSIPAEASAKAAHRDDTSKRDRRSAEPQPSETPQAALARIAIPQDTIDQISELMVPGSSLVVSDQGLGPETGAGTDFIVLTH